MNTVMKITVDRNDLAAAVTWAGKGLSRRPAVPVLGGMRLEVAGGRLTLAAFDYDVSATASVNGVGIYTSNPAEPGVILVNGAALAAVVKAMPRGKTVRAELEREDTPAIEATEDTPARGATSALVVRCQGSESRLTAMDDSDYPALPALPAAAGVVASDAFRRAAGRITPLAGRDDTLPVLTTVRFELGETLTLAATDRYRLGAGEVDWTAASITDAADGPQAMQVPAAVFAAFGKAAGRDGKVTVHYAPAHTADDTAGTHIPARGGFSDDSRTIVFRAEFGDFPRYQALLPDSSSMTALVDAAALSAAVKRVATLAERNTAVRLTFGPQVSHVTITAGTDGESSAQERVTAAYDGPDAMTVAYNPEYLRSVLDGTEGEAWLSWVTPGKPLQVTSTDTADSFRALVMPIRIAS